MDDEDERDPLWQVACRYQELKAQAARQGMDVSVIRKIAVEGILRRTLKLIRHFRRKTHVVREPWVGGRSGDIALIETLEQATNSPELRAEDVIIESREEKPLDLVMMIDTSLSMTGRKIALCAVGAAVLAFRLRAKAFAIVAFGSTAQVLKPLGASLTPQETIERILEAPVLGYTNIATGLQRGSSELRKGRAPLKAGILLTDGSFTEGPDPQTAAGGFRRLEILMTLDHNMDRECCRRMAHAGHGHITEVRRYRHLPERLLALIRALQQ